MTFMKMPSSLDANGVCPSPGAAIPVLQTILDSSKPIGLSTLLRPGRPHSGPSRRCLLWHFALLLVVTTLQLPARAASFESPQAARESIRAADLMRHVKVLSSDEFEGRSPGT